MVNNNRLVENTFNMLVYLYPELGSKRFRNFDITGIDSIDNLYASIIARWCTSIAKEGLYKEYIQIENEEMTSPKGQINVQESITRQTKSRGTLICSYDELSENIYINHILKGTLQHILYDSDISTVVKTDVQKSMQMFNGVEYTDINFVHWKSIKYNNNNIRYKHLIEMCKRMVFERKLEKSGELDDSKRVFLLFKEQLLKWCKAEYGEEDSVEILEVPYNYDIDNPFEVKMTKIQQLIIIRTETAALALCIKLQDERLIEDPTLGKKQMYELVKHLREYKKENKVKVAGCIVYVNTDKTKLNLQPITVNAVNDYMVGETTVDIHDQWRFIANKLNDCYKYFIQREKNKKKPKAKQ